MMAAVKAAVARFLPGSSVEVAEADLAHAKAELAAAEQAYADEGSQSKWKAVKEAEELVRQAKLLRNGAVRRADIEAQKRAAEERAKLEAEGQRLLADLEETAQRGKLSAAIEALLRAPLEILDALEAIETADREAAAKLVRLRQIEDQTGATIAPRDSAGLIALRQVGPFVRGDARDRLHALIGDRFGRGKPMGSAERDVRKILAIV
jgi:hypothetical protein